MKRLALSVDKGHKVEWAPAQPGSMGVHVDMSNAQVATVKTMSQESSKARPNCVVSMPPERVSQSWFFR